MPIRGASSLFDVVYGSRLLDEAKSNPPVGRNSLTGNSGSGDLAYAASAACVTWLVAPKLNPTVCRSWLSVVGVAFSQRKPRLRVIFGRICQSSWTNKAL